MSRCVLRSPLAAGHPLLRRLLPASVLLAILLVSCGGGGGGGDDGDDGGGEFSVTTIAPEASVNGALSSSDLKVPDGSYADLYQVTIPTAGTLTVQMTSAEVDAYLYVFEDECLDVADLEGWLPFLLAEDDDSGGNLDARVSLPLPAGTFVIVANSVGVEEGAYQLATSFRAASPREPLAEAGFKKIKTAFRAHP